MSCANVSVSVYHKGRDGVLHPYDSDKSGLILDAARKGVASVDIGWGENACRFDLSTMKQVKRGSRRESEDIVIEIPFTTKNLKAAREADGLRRKILVMALDRIREQQFLSKSLDVKGVPYQSVRANPYLKSGHSPYENFLESLTRATAPLQSEGVTLYDTILETAATSPTDGNLRSLDKQGLQLVFHGTNEAVMDDILDTGLLPNFRVSTTDRIQVAFRRTRNMRSTRRTSLSRLPHRPILRKNQELLHSNTHRLDSSRLMPITLVSSSRTGRIATELALRVWACTVLGEIAVFAIQDEPSANLWLCKRSRRFGTEVAGYRQLC
ncbi:hypothetical protein R1sor_016313 [Riccia sorocarpa]|uniref:Uncharacterized protein n=1 Tax=Riccia sorocarpa TaxID=122646 RepID=A0ABD3HKT9_9MARC